MPARSARSFYLHLAIPGWQGRVEEHHDIELRDALTHATVLTLTPLEVIRMLTHYVGAATITADLLALQPSSGLTRAQMLPSPSAPDRRHPRAVGVPLRPVQEARRAARAARRKAR